MINFKTKPRDKCELKTLTVSLKNYGYCCNTPPFQMRHSTQQYCQQQYYKSKFINVIFYYYVVKVWQLFYFKYFLSSVLLYLLACVSSCLCLPLSVTETMAVDSMLPSPSSLSSPMLGLEGLPGRRRKKRTSIETNVRVALERNFNTVGLI